MTQLTLKELAQRIEDLAADIHIEDVLLRLGALEDTKFPPLALGEDGELISLTVPATDANPLPAWGLEIVEALIEALKGVRLQGAQTFALALEAKYFPLEVVEEEEVVA